MAEQTQQELKRLAPVIAISASASATAGSLYTRAKTYVPVRLQGTMEAAELRVSDLAAPYLPALLDKGASALRVVDAKVDSTILSAHSALTSGHALEQLSATRAAYLKRVEEAVGALSSQGLHDTAKAAAEQVLAKVAEARAALRNPLGEVEAVWGRFAALFEQASRGGVDLAWTKYTAAHDAVVADPRYASAVGKGTQLLAGLQATAAYQAASARLAPLLSPVAETALAKAAEPWAKAVASHLAPATAVAAS